MLVGPVEGAHTEKMKRKNRKDSSYEEARKILGTEQDVQ